MRKARVKPRKTRLEGSASGHDLGVDVKTRFAGRMGWHQNYSRKAAGWREPGSSEQG